MNLHNLARVLGGDVAGHDRVLCPGPGHSPRDRSLSVTFTADAFTVHSFSGDPWQQCRDHVRGLLGMGDFQGPRREVRTASRPAPANDDADRTARAMDLWREARPIPGTPADAYLRRRGVPYSGGALRWHSNCPFGKGASYACLLGLVRNIVTNEPQAIHRTALDADGRKMSHLGSNGRLAYGPTAGGAIKLTDDAEVTLAVAIGEGTESALSIRRLPNLENMPVWACISAGGIEHFPVLAGIETLWIAVDHDPAGIRAARQCARRWSDAGRELMMVAPEVAGADLNDLGSRAACC